MHLDPLLPRLLWAALVLLLMGLALRRLRRPAVETGRPADRAPGV